MLESLNYSFRNPKNIIWVIYRNKQLRNYKKKNEFLRGPQLGKQRWRARLGILRVKLVTWNKFPVIWRQNQTRAEMRSLWSVWSIGFGLVLLHLWICCFKANKRQLSNPIQIIIKLSSPEKLPNFHPDIKFLAFSKACCRMYNRPPPLVALLSQINPNYVSATSLFENSSTYRFFQCFFPSG